MDSNVITENATVRMARYASGARRFFKWDLGEGLRAPVAAYRGLSSTGMRHV